MDIVLPSYINDDIIHIIAEYGVITLFISRC